MRALKFIGVFLATAAIVFGIVLGLNWKSFTTFLDNREAFAEGTEFIPKTHSLRGMSEFMGENPEYASVASIVVSRPDSAIYLQEHHPRTLGAVANFFILTAYANLIDSGEITINESIPVQHLSRYLLPDVEELKHSETLRTINRRGLANDGTILLQDLLTLLAETNDLAIADYLWWKAGPDTWNQLSDLLQLENTDMPLPFSGLYLAISPGIQNQPFDEILQEWQDRGTKEFREHVIDISYRYAHSDEFRNETRTYLENERLGNTFMEERDALQLFPSGTASELTSLLEAMMDNTLINEAVSSMVANWMSWPMERQRGINQNFSHYGAIYDNRMGMMNGIDFGTSAYTSDTTVQALFLDRLPIGFWFHASSGHMHQDLMQRLIYDPAMIEQMEHVVQPNIH